MYIYSLVDPNYVMANERMNLMNMAKLSIKGLIESALNLGRTLDSDYAPLQQFFVVMEHCLKHGLKAKKTFLGQNKSFWGPLELVEKFVPEAGEITASVKDLPGLNSILEGHDSRRKGESLATPGIDAEETFRVHESLDKQKGNSQVGVIDFSMYLKDGSSSKGSEGDGQITAILDQKNYVEELNRHLSATVNNLQAKVDALEKSNTKLTEELAVANNRIITLQEEMERVKEESSYILESNRKVNKQDRTADGHALTEARKQLKEETQLRLDVEKELETQIGMRQEMELAMKMLEKDVCEKQDALVVLRQQLDDLRALKLELSFKLQSSDLGMKQKSELNSRLEEKTSQMAATIKLLEQRGQLEVELRREREQWLHLPHGVPDNKSLLSPNKGIQKTGSKTDSNNRHLEGDLQSRASVKENTVLSSSVFPVLQDEQEQASEKSKPCQLCQEESTRGKRKNICKNCGGVFCEDCSANELPLPSSIKPERVCNFCHEHLIQQYSPSPS
ncbi:putative Protein RUFY3 protein [Naja naja]|nr:putative Protein RUFY3 protein [Naja naja]